MSSVVERAKAHFSDRLTKIGRIEVPEWGESEDKPLVITWRPMTLKERDQIFKYLSKNSLEGMAEALILRARDENGDKIFRPVHKTEIMRHFDPDVIDRIIQAMGNPDYTVEEAEKN